MYIYIILFQVYLEAGQWRQAVEALDNLTADGLRPDVVTYSTLIRCC